MDRDTYNWVCIGSSNKILYKMAHKSSKEESAYKLAGLTIDLFQKLRNDKTFLSQIEWFNNLSEREREQLVQGNYELVKKSILEKRDIIMLAEFNGPISTLFSTNKTGKNQYHTDDFKELIAKVPHIEVPEMRVKTFTLKKKMNDFEIGNELGDNERLAFTSKAEALRVLGSTITDDYRDGRASIVFYLDISGELCYAICSWSGVNTLWVCDAYRRAFAPRWVAGNRILYPET